MTAPKGRECNVWVQGGSECLVQRGGRWGREGVEPVYSSQIQNLKYIGDFMPLSVVETWYVSQVGYMTFNFQKNAKMLLLQQQKQLEKGEFGSSVTRPPPLPDPPPVPSLTIVRSRHTISS